MCGRMYECNLRTSLSPTCNPATLRHLLLRNDEIKKEEDDTLNTIEIELSK